MQLLIAMPTNPATSADVNELLGEIDPLVLEQILATGATPEEIGEAVSVVEQEHGFGEEPHEPSSPRVAEVRALLQHLSVLEREVEPEEDMM
jgi:hypothetical protein